MHDSYLSTEDIINWIETWAMKNPNPTETDVEDFAKLLNEQMMKLDYKVENGKTVIGYAGRITNENSKTGIFHTVQNIVEGSNGKYCFINNSAENILNNGRFNAVLYDAVGEGRYTNIVFGTWENDVRSKYSFDGVLSLNDLVSDNFMLNNARGDVCLLEVEMST